MVKPQKQRPKRNIVKMEIDNTGKAAIKDTADHLAMKEQAVLGRLVKWFESQPDVVRKHILGVLPEGYEVDILQLALDRQAAKKAGQSPAKK